MTEYIFIDGNSLRMHLKTFADRYAGGAELSFSWINVKGRFEKAFYYDAIPVREASESEAEHNDRIQKISTLHEMLSEIDGFRVYEGDARKRSGRGLEQKKVDVMIAVDMLTHTIRRNMNSAGLIAGDLDFKPLLDALVNEGMYVTLFYPPRATSKELRAAADARKPLTPRLTYQWLDIESKNLVGRMPSVSIRNGKAVDNCTRICEVEGNGAPTEVWHHLPDDTIVVTYLNASPNTYLHLSQSNWDRTRLLAKDEFSITLPQRLPKGFEHL